MMRLLGLFVTLFALFMVLFATDANADVLVSFGTNTSFNQASDGRNYDIDTALAFRGGYRFTIADVYLEYSRYSRTESVGVFGTDRSHSEWTAWGRHVLQIPWFVQPYVAGGIGIQSDTIATRFGNDSTTDSGTPELTAQLATGIRKILMGRLNLELEGKMGVSRTYAPNPLLGVGVYIGWSF